MRKRPPAHSFTPRVAIHKGKRIYISLFFSSRPKSVEERRDTEIVSLVIYCFTRTIVRGDWLEIKEHLAYAIKKIVEGAGTSFAFPSRSLYLETLPRRE